MITRTIIIIRKSMISLPAMLIGQSVMYVEKYRFRQQNEEENWCKDSKDSFASTHTHIHAPTHAYTITLCTCTRRKNYYYYYYSPIIIVLSGIRFDSKLTRAFSVNPENEEEKLNASSQ